MYDSYSVGESEDTAQVLHRFKTMQSPSQQSAQAATSCHTAPVSKRFDFSELTLDAPPIRRAAPQGRE